MKECDLFHFYREYLLGWRHHVVWTPMLLQWVLISDKSKKSELALNILRWLTPSKVCHLPVKRWSSVPETIRSFKPLDLTDQCTLHAGLRDR